MSSQEELAMLIDAERIPQEQKQESAAAQIYAIQAGLELGKKRGKKLVFARSAMTVLTAVVMIAGLLFFNPTQLLPQGTSSVETVDWGVLEPFKKLAESDVDALTLESAIRNDYVQIVNKSAEKNGYKITLNAVIADENKIILLYTGTTSGGQEIYNVNSVWLTDAVTGQSVVDKNGSRGGMGLHAVDSIYTWLGKTIYPLDKNKAFPKELVANFQIASVDPGMLAKPKTGTDLADMRYSDRLKVSFAIDSKFWEQKTETVVLNQPFMIDGHVVNLAQVELSPLSIVVEFTLSEALKTDWEIRNEIFGETPSELTSRIGKHEMKNNSIGGSGSEDGFISYFSSNVLDHPKSLRLKLDAGPDREKEEYIDILRK
ncbi:DUF4179 domain-containing protein [Paenibacillus sp. FSL K6-3166]|uniref:DUF4179 domain-containing protein n=1 Tax=unclassified Paenibacillus TaxID=185978 RepID=UPI000BA09CFD|nr:DUF4179 domain-containing protein [Paenibacillus sp. VTT E-133291]OZQ87971.1 hypothetical protein CA598_15970 [Paenibacillus sp. VTT E-133291]